MCAVSKTFPAGSIGLCYVKTDGFDSYGVIVKTTPLGNYHVCMQRKDRKDMYEIVADTRRPDIAEEIRLYLIKDQELKAIKAKYKIRSSAQQ